MSAIHVFTGKRLKDYAACADYDEKRGCCAQIQKYLRSPADGKVLSLVGFIGMGNTTMMAQAINEMTREELDKTCLMILSEADTLAQLEEEIRELDGEGYEYFFIDEITGLDDFVTACGSVFENIPGMARKKVVLTGSDSFGFILADRYGLRGRQKMLNTSRTNFHEFSRLLKFNDVKKYIRYGGSLLHKYSDDDTRLAGSPFASSEMLGAFMRRAFSLNISKTFRRNKDLPPDFNRAERLREEGLFTNAVSRVVAYMNERPVLDSLREMAPQYLPLFAKFIPQSGSLPPGETGRAIRPYEGLLKSLVEEYLECLEINSKIDKYITKADMAEILECLDAIGLIGKVSDVEWTDAEDVSAPRKSRRIIFRQPGLRCGIGRTLLRTVEEKRYLYIKKHVDLVTVSYRLNPAYQGIAKQEDALRKLCGAVWRELKEKILKDVVLLEATDIIADLNEKERLKENGGRYEAYKLICSAADSAAEEIDAVLFDKRTCEYRLFEVRFNKNSEKTYGSSLDDEHIGRLLESRLKGKIAAKTILYRGPSRLMRVDDSGEPRYKQTVLYNIEDFLNEIEADPISLFEDRRAKLMKEQKS